MKFVYTSKLCNCILLFLISNDNERFGEVPTTTMNVAIMTVMLRHRQKKVCVYGNMQNMQKFRNESFKKVHCDSTKKCPKMSYFTFTIAFSIHFPSLDMEIIFDETLKMTPNSFTYVYCYT